MSEFFFVGNAQTAGPHVPALHRALLLLLERGALLKDDDGIRHELRRAFEREVSEQVVGDATRKLLSIFSTRSTDAPFASSTRTIAITTARR